MGTPYIGRFAPSPTGPLHAGSLVAALASYLDAKKAGGAWRVRIDDIDPPREMPGAAAAILSCLQTHGLQWDDEVQYQSQHTQAYLSAVQRLLSMEHAFRCRCTRANLDASGSCIADCQRQVIDEKTSCSIRLALRPDMIVRIDDRIYSTHNVALREQMTNFVIRRRDGLIAYQLAAAVDDGTGITDVVRGEDLLSSTPRQILLQQLLGLHTPRYAHTPLILGEDGHKLSKQTGAPPLENSTPIANLDRALQALRQPLPPPYLTKIPQRLAWATRNWDIKALQRNK